MHWDRIALQRKKKKTRYCLGDRWEQNKQCWVATAGSAPVRQAFSELKVELKSKQCCGVRHTLKRERFSEIKTWLICRVCPCLPPASWHFFQRRGRNAGVQPCQDAQPWLPGAEGSIPATCFPFQKGMFHPTGTSYSAGAFEKSQPATDRKTVMTLAVRRPWESDLETR